MYDNDNMMMVVMAMVIAGHQWSAAAFHFSQLLAACRTWSAWNGQVGIICQSINLTCKFGFHISVSSFDHGNWCQVFSPTISCWEHIDRIIPTNDDATWCHRPMLMYILWSFAFSWSLLLSGSYMWNKTEIKQICFRFVSDEIVLFQFYFSTSYMWNKTLKQIESRRCFCRAHLSISSK